MDRARIVVAGAGAFGAWSALTLRRRGSEVLLVDPWGPGNSRASSGGATRVVRAAYGPAHACTEMVAASLPAWRALERDARRHLFTPSPVLWLFGRDDAYLRESLPALAAAGLAAEPLPIEQLVRRWPAIQSDDGIRSAWLEQTAGVVEARESCRALVEVFAREGGRYREAAARPGARDGERLLDVELSDGTRERADAFLFACGPWLPRLFPDEAGPAVRVTRQEIVVFGTPEGATGWSLGELPIWVELGDDVFYGIPAHGGRGFKIGEDVHGPSFDPTSGERRVGDAVVARARSFIARRFPGLTGAPVVDARVCQYSVTPDGQLLLDRHPRLGNVLLAGGGSGHGFKLSPALGELAADVLIGRREPPAELRLRGPTDDAGRRHPAFPGERPPAD